MARLSFGSMPLHGRLILPTTILLVFAAPAVYGKGRSAPARPVMMPAMTHSAIRPMTSPMMARSMTPSTTSAMARSMTPSMMSSTMTNRMRTTPSTTTNITNALLRRDIRLDSHLLRNERLDQILRRDFGLGGFPGMPFGAGSTWGMGGGGLLGSGISVIPAGGAVASATPVAQKSSGDTEDTARAALLLEQAVAERLANRRRAFDELLYERDKAPVPEQELLSRSRGNPPSSEVLSGQALNALLDDLRAPAATDAVDRPNALLPLDKQGLRHINVTHGAGSVALLKNGGQLSWPAGLTGAAFQEPRERLTAQTAEVVRLATSSGRVDPAALRQMAADVGQLRALLSQNAKELSFQTYTEARDFLQRFDGTLVALRQPDAADYFNGKYVLNAQTVLGLVKQMSDAGLRFGPAVAGDEAAYASLREALAACDRAVAMSQTSTH